MPTDGAVADQHDLGDRDGFGMSDGDEAASYAQTLRQPGSGAMQLELRRPGPADDLDILPQDPARMTGAEGFHRGFLHREPACQVGNRIAPSRTIRNLAVGEDAAQEAIAVSFQNLRNPREVGRVHADADDVHESERLASA